MEIKGQAQSPHFSSWIFPSQTREKISQNDYCHFLEGS